MPLTEQEYFLEKREARYLCDALIPNFEKYSFEKQAEFVLKMQKAMDKAKTTMVIDCFRSDLPVAVIERKPPASPISLFDAAFGRPETETSHGSDLGAVCLIAIGAVVCKVVEFLRNFL